VVAWTVCFVLASITLFELLNAGMGGRAAGTAEGHMFAGWITFSAYEEDGVTAAQVQVLMRAQDPLGELGLAFGGHSKENRFWEQTLANLAGSLGCEEAEVSTNVVCVDRKRQWSRAKNVRHSAAIRSTLHMMRPGK
jgi:hypothetical protein